jgi:hypothetical protein
MWSGLQQWHYSQEPQQQQEATLGMQQLCNHVSCGKEEK